MMIRNLFLGACGMLIPMSAARAQSLPESPVPPESEIRRILADRIGGAGLSAGIVIGVIEPKGTRVVAYGSRAQGDKRPLDGNTIFEIGSVTEVFTSLLLTDMVQRGEVALDDPVAKFLPEGVKVPERGGRRITLEDLSTHTSGLPRLPSNLEPANPANPFADYSAERLYQFLSTYKLWRDIGPGFEYSNLGGGLLGHALARRAGMTYGALVKSRITQPLAMNSTRITLSPEMKARLAVGHDVKLAAVPNYDFQVLAGAGALRSSANDLLVFLSANLGYSNSPLTPAMAAMLKVRRPTTIPGTEMALGWVVDAGGIVWRNGSSAGYRSFVGYQPASRAGVVVLSNTFTNTGLNDIGMHLLDARHPLAGPPKAPTDH
ncbi:MAG TPA: serine hydrolase domain-containing protein [Candidatus Acidoferrales bacterium]|nr:serine hydrolase domain-containing protein [Candidatus Acidoferrales bacterium]